MRYLFFIFSFTLFTSLLYTAEKPSGPLEHVKQDFDVILYDLFLDLTAFPSKNTLAENNIYFTMENNVPGNFFFHLQDLNIDSVFLNGQKTEVQFNEDDYGGYYSVSVDSPQDTNELSVHYHGLMTAENNNSNWGGVHTISNNIFSLGVGFSADYVSCARHFMPCYDHPSDKAYFRCSLKVIDGIMGVSNGLLVEEIHGEEFNTYVWEQNRECSTYLLNFSVANQVKTVFGDSPPVEVYASTFLQENVNYVFETVPDMIDLYEDKFGDFPFEKCGYVLTAKGSMEHASLISIATDVVNSYYSKKDVYKYTVVHELAHQWFGDCVTPADYRDAWLSEGFATFCEALWREDLEGKNGLYRKISLDAEYYRDELVDYEGILSLYDFDRNLPSSNYPATIYYKGSAVLFMLMDLLGEEMFYKGVNEYLVRYYHDNASTEDFISVMEEVSERDLGFFFDQWVYGKGYPMIDIEFKECGDYSGDGYCFEEIAFTQVQPELFGLYDSLKLIIEFETIDNKFFTREFKLSGESTFADLGEDFIVKRILGINNDINFRSLLEIGDINIPVTVVERRNYEDVLINPNPVRDILKINVEEQQFDRIEIYDFYGKIVLSEKIIGNNKNLNIDIKSLSSGSYILRLIGRNELKSGKFIIEK